MHPGAQSRRGPHPRVDRHGLAERVRPGSRLTKMPLVKLKISKVSSVRFVLFFFLHFSLLFQNRFSSAVLLSRFENQELVFNEDSFDDVRFPATFTASLSDASFQNGAHGGVDLLYANGPADQLF